MHSCLDISTLICKYIKKQDKSCDLSCLVDYTGKSSNFFENLTAFDEYSQSVENNIDTLTDKTLSNLEPD